MWVNSAMNTDRFFHSFTLASKLVHSVSIFVLSINELPQRVASVPEGQSRKDHQVATARESNFLIFMVISFDLQFNKSFLFYICFFAFIVIHVYVCVTMCGYVHLNTGTCQN